MWHAVHLTVVQPPNIIMFFDKFAQCFNNVLYLSNNSTVGTTYFAFLVQFFDVFQNMEYECDKGKYPGIDTCMQLLLLQMLKCTIPLIIFPAFSL
jgi:hypothetical protein